MRRGDDLANRLLQFAATVLRLVAKLPTDRPSKEAGKLSVEADELVAILTASVRTAVARSRGEG